jgi:rubrerythrin
MAAWVESRDEAAQQLVAGVRAKGEYRCAGCGYGVTVYRELPRCPMCGQDRWEQQDWSPFGRTAPTLDETLDELL